MPVDVVLGILCACVHACTVCVFLSQAGVGMEFEISVRGTVHVEMPYIRSAPLEQSTALAPQGSVGLESCPEVDSELSSEGRQSLVGWEFGSLGLGRGGENRKPSTFGRW